MKFATGRGTLITIIVNRATACLLQNSEAIAGSWKL